MSKKTALAVGGILVVVAIGVGVFLFVRHNQEKNKQKTGAPLYSDINIKDVQTTPIEDITKQYAGKPDLIYGELISAGSRKQGVKKYTEAIAYFQAASKATPDQERKDEADKLVYYAAKAAGDTKLTSDYAALLGQKLQQTFRGPGNDVDGQ